MAAASIIVAPLRHDCETLGILTPRPCHPFRFLDLPAEIRLLVYKELFGGSRVHIVWGDDNIPSKVPTCEDRPSKHPRGAIFHYDHDNTSCRLQSAILRTCRTVHDKALPLLYASPIFEFRWPPYRNVSHIRLVMTWAVSFEALKEAELAQMHLEVGLQWDKLQLWAVHVSCGLGTDIVKSLVDFGTSRPPIEYKASDVEWLYQAKNTQELKHLGLCFRPLPNEWFIKIGSAPLHDKSSKSTAKF